jgi:phosphoserine aminotransferase
VVLGNGGSTAFWDAATFGLVRERALHLDLRRVLGEVRRVDEGRPVPRRPGDRQGRAGLRPGPAGRPELRRPRLGAQRNLDGRDGPGRAARRRHGGAARGDRRDVGRRRPARRRRAGRRLLLRAAEELRRDGGLFLALLSPAALERVAELAASDRWIPPFLSLAVAVDNSGKDQTYNTPAVATLYLLAEQIDWMLGLGGLDGCTARTADSAQRLYTWAEKSPFATPFVRDPEHRSQVVGTVDFDDAVDAAAVAKVLRTNGIVDTEPYRKLGRNQLRIGMFPAVDPDDVSALTACVDWVVERLV